MKTAISIRPTGGHLFVASTVAMLVSLMTMGAIVALVALAGEGAPSFLVITETLLVGAVLGLLGGPTGSPIAVVAGTLLFLLLGRLLVHHELSTGAYKRGWWIAAGAALGIIVQAVIDLQQAAFPGIPVPRRLVDLPLYGPALATGVVGMLLWRAVIVAVTRRGLC